MLLQTHMIIEKFTEESGKKKRSSDISEDSYLALIELHGNETWMPSVSFRAFLRSHPVQSFCFRVRSNTSDIALNTITKEENRFIFVVSDHSCRLDPVSPLKGSRWLTFMSIRGINRASRDQPPIS